MPPKASTSGSNGPPLPLPAFLKLLTSSPKAPLTMRQAMSAASKLIPAGYTSLDQLNKLTMVDMARLGIDDEDVRKGIMILLGKGKDGKGKGKAKDSPGKRKRGSDLDRPLMDRETRTVVQVDLDFDEILAEETLQLKSCVVNRAPVMTAWATVVAERLGFKRQEALSIAQVFTDLNASSKGVSLGILPESRLKAGAGPSQPFVELMGRKVPVLAMQDGEWRAISQSAVVEPSAAFSYLQRNFRQQLGALIGALRLLAESFEPQELNKKGYGLYCEFRPESDGWGKKADMPFSRILDLRRFLTHDIKDTSGREGGAGETQEDARERLLEAAKEEEEEEEEVGVLEPSRKKPKVEEPPAEDVAQAKKDEFDAALDDDDDWDLAELEGIA